MTHTLPLATGFSSLLFSLCMKDGWRREKRTASFFSTHYTIFTTHFIIAQCKEKGKARDGDGGERGRGDRGRGGLPQKGR